MDTLFIHEYPPEVLAAMDVETNAFVHAFTADLINGVNHPKANSFAKTIENNLGDLHHTPASRFHLWRMMASVRIMEFNKLAIPGNFVIPPALKLRFVNAPPADEQELVQHLYRCAYLIVFNFFGAYYKLGVLFLFSKAEILGTIQPWFVAHGQTLNDFHTRIIVKRTVVGVSGNTNHSSDTSQPWDNGLPFPWWGMHGILWTLALLLELEEESGVEMEPLAQTMSKVLAGSVNYYGWKLFYHVGSALDIWSQRTGIALETVAKLNGKPVEVKLSPTQLVNRKWKNPR